MYKNECLKTLSGKHRWKDYFDGFDPDSKNLIDGWIGSKSVPRCDACGMIDDTQAEEGEMTKGKVKLREKIERLEMSDQNSKGCSVMLGEWLSKENVSIIENLVEALLASQRQEIEKKEGDIYE